MRLTPVCDLTTGCNTIEDCSFPSNYQMLIPPQLLAIAWPPFWFIAAIFSGWRLWRSCTCCVDMRMWSVVSGKHYFLDIKTHLWLLWSFCLLFSENYWALQEGCNRNSHLSWTLYSLLFLHFDYLVSLC